MVAWWPKQKPRLLQIDDCLMDALDPAAADECLVEPAAKSEIVDVQSAAFIPVAVTLVILCLVVSMLASQPAVSNLHIKTLPSPVPCSEMQLDLTDSFEPSTRVHRTPTPAWASWVRRRSCITRCPSWM